ncbi:MAG: hypothetical protein EHM61_10575 [Acidobacteria bacterium]|nr:MAG: hypothetical protein EHM61_10575 [Acidobacteriota bacterium]
MLEVMKYKQTIQDAASECGCRFQSVSEAQTGNGWKRYRVEYQKDSGRRERIFIYLFDKSTDASVKDDVVRGIRYQEELSQQIAAAVAESA